MDEETHIDAHANAQTHTYISFLSKKGILVVRRINKSEQAIIKYVKTNIDSFE